MLLNRPIFQPQTVIMFHGTFFKLLKPWAMIAFISWIQMIYPLHVSCVRGAHTPRRQHRGIRNVYTYTGHGSYPSMSRFSLDIYQDDEDELVDEEGNHRLADDLDSPEITWGEPNSQTVYFDDMTPTNVTAVVGQSALLPCTVVNIGGKHVTWIRKRDIHILTVGIFTYTSDDRFKVVHPKKSDEWNLEISPVTFRDAGVYECQVSTNPKISLPVILGVEVQQARIPGPKELFIRNGSTISLTCLVNTHSENVGAVTWFRNGKRLDYDSPRGGVSLEVEKTPEKTTSKLHITRAIKADSGNFTCAPQFADAESVVVHVVSGEESAAVQTGSSAHRQLSVRSNIFALAITFTIFFIDNLWEIYFQEVFNAGNQR